MSATSKIPMAKYPNPGGYAKAWRAGLEAARLGFEVKVAYGEYLKPEQIRPYFLKALDGRINERGGMERKGRKADTDYQTRLWRDSRAVRGILTRRLRVYQFETREAYSRFADLLADPTD